MVTIVPNVTNWSVTPQNGQVGYFTLMNTWLFESTNVIASLNTAITKINEAGNDINVIGQNAINAISLDTIEDLATYTGTGLVMIKDINRGGTFVSKTAIEIDPNTGSLYVANGGTVFAKLGGGFWVRRYSGAVNVKWFGAKVDGVTNDTAATLQAVETGQNVNLGDGELLISDTIIPKVSGQCIFGSSNLTSIIRCVSDKVAIHINQTDGNTLSNFKVIGSKLHSSSSHGIQIGLPTGGYGSRVTLSNIIVDSCGGDGIRISDGNLGTLHDIISISNNGHGVNFTNEASDNNAWNQSGRLDVRGNNGDGLHIDYGAASSKTNNFTYVVAQENDGYGLFIGSRNNKISYYSELNGLGAAYLANNSGAVGNDITALFGGLPIEEVPNVISGNNVLSNNSFSANYSRAFKNMFFEDKFLISRAGRIGSWSLEVDSTIDRKLNLKGYVSSGSNWTLDMTAGLTGTENGVTVKAKEFVGSAYSIPKTLAVGSSTLNIADTNVVVLSNVAPVNYNGVIGYIAGKIFTVLGDGQSSISGSNVTRKSGSPAVLTNGELFTFMCHPTVPNRIKEIGNSI